MTSEFLLFKIGLDTHFTRNTALRKSNFGIAQEMAGSVVVQPAQGGKHHRVRY